MSDRTRVWATIYACPSEHVEAVLAVLNDYGFRPDEDAYLAYFDGITDFSLGSLYALGNGSVGTASEVALALTKHLGVAFEVGEEAVGAEQGVLIRHCRELGTWSSKATAAGEVYLDTSDVEEIIALLPTVEAGFDLASEMSGQAPDMEAMRAALVDLLEDRVGLPHRRALEALLGG